MAAAKSAIGSGQKDQPTIPMATPTIPMAKIVDPNDPHVIEIAKFAVKKYKEHGTDLVFINVEFGFLWSLDGATYYLLAIQTQDDKATYSDVALVVDNKGTYVLIWYNHKKMAAAPAIGSGQKDQPIIPMAIIVDPNDPHVIEIARFAVKKYNERGTDLVFINVEFGFRWSRPDGNYYLLAIQTQDDKGKYSDVPLVVDDKGTYELKWYNHKNN